MHDEVERLAQEIHTSRPVTIDGRQLVWDDVVRLHPTRAEIYREAARNRLRADDAMKRLASEPVRRKPT